jgi:hypothetical protein
MLVHREMADERQRRVICTDLLFLLEPLRDGAEVGKGESRESFRMSVLQLRES